MILNRKTIVSSLKNPSSALQTAILVTVPAFVYLLRSSQYLFNPQLYGDDGPNWLAAGYNNGLSVVFRQVNGFLHVPERLFGVIVAQLPLQLAPGIFNITGWFIFILFTYYLFSSRTKVLTNNYERLSMMLALCLIANIEEFFFNFSNSMFLIGVVGVLIIAAKKPKNLILAIGEKILFLFTCFTLPFAWFYMPITLIEHFKYRLKGRFFLYASVVGSFAQLIVLSSSHANRSSITLQSLFSVHILLEIFNQIIIPAMRFARLDVPTFTAANPVAIYGIYTVLLSTLTLLLAIYVVVRRSNRQVWYLLFFLGAMTFASLKSPQLKGDPVKVIQFLSVVTGGDRYFVYGILAVNIIFIKSTYIALTSRVRYVFTTVFFGFGLITSLHYKAFYIEKNFVDLRSQYHQGIDLFESGAVKSVAIPINPHDANNWQVKLKAR